VPALLLLVPATVALSASIASVEAADECRVKPGLAAPSGSRWVYRINRTDRRHCWFLRSKAVGFHSQLSRRHRHVASDNGDGAVRQDQQSDINLQTPTLSTGESDVVAAVEPPTVSQVATPFVEQASENLVPRSVPTIAYRLPPPNVQTSAGQAGVEHSAERASAGASKSNVILLAGAAAAGLVFAGGALHLTRRVHQRTRERSVIVRHEVRGLPVIRSLLEAMPSPVRPDPAQNLKRSLRELRCDLNRASEAVSSPSRDGRPASRSAILLPHAAAWLSRAHAKPTVEESVV
jgi:hypothetical protein